MIQKFEIVGLFGNRNIQLDMTERSLIITGDNGNGKTTILNALYSVLVGDVKALFNLDFENMSLKFKKKYRQVREISIDVTVSSESKKMRIDYFLRKQKPISIYCEKMNYLDDDRIYVDYIMSDYITPDYKDDISQILQHERMFFFGKNQNMVDIAEEWEEMEFYYFLRELNQSVLYFPTYRRIDIDMEDFLEDNQSEYLRHMNIPNIIRRNNTVKDRRVIGISNDDIVSNLNFYTKDINAFTSENLDKLLKNFVKQFIERVMKPNKNIKLSPHSKGVHIYEMLDNLNMALDLRINDEQLKTFSSEYDENKQRVNQIATAFKKENIEEDGKKSYLYQLLALQSPWEEYLPILEKLYTNYQKMLANELENYKYISANISLFTNGKIELRRRKNNEFIIEKNSKEITFEKLSTGEKQLFTFFVYCSLHLPKERGAIVIIDEPELSLHPKWQSMLLRHLLEKKNISIISATHSPFIIDDDLEGAVVTLVED